MTIKFSSTSNSGIKHQQLLGKVLFPTTVSILKHIELGKESNALCLNCGEGEIVFHLSKLIGNKGQVVGIDPNAENIHTAIQLGAIKKNGNSSFVISDRTDAGNSGSFDFIHYRLPLISFYDIKESVRLLRDKLVVGGKILFEVIEFSGFNSIHENFAFKRFLDLYSALIKEYWGSNSFCTHLYQELIQTGFHSVNHQFIPPIFLKGDYKQLPSLTLKCIKNELIVQKLSTEDEIELLLAEMKSFEKDDHSLINSSCDV